MKPRPASERIVDAIPVFFTVLQEITNPDILSDAMWALSYFSEEYPRAKISETDIILFITRFLE